MRATLCAKIDAGLLPLAASTKRKNIEGVRTSESCNFDVHDPLVAEIESAFRR